MIYWELVFHLIKILILEVWNKLQERTRYWTSFVKSNFECLRLLHYLQSALPQLFMFILQDLIEWIIRVLCRGGNYLRGFDELCFSIWRSIIVFKQKCIIVQISTVVQKATSAFNHLGFYDFTAFIRVFTAVLLSLSCLDWFHIISGLQLVQECLNILIWGGIRVMLAVNLLHFIRDIWDKSLD